MTTYYQLKGMELGPDGGYAINDQMMTSIAGVYAAGDCCSATWPPAPQWFQMRLWTQARQMGAFAAKCMVASSTETHVPLDICFELFTHATSFFGYKV